MVTLKVEGDKRLAVFAFDIRSTNSKSDVCSFLRMNLWFSLDHADSHLFFQTYILICRGHNVCNITL